MLLSGLYISILDLNHKHSLSFSSINQFSTGALKDSSSLCALHTMDGSAKIYLYTFVLVLLLEQNISQVEKKEFLIRLCIKTS